MSETTRQSESGGNSVGRPAMRATSLNRKPSFRECSLLGIGAFGLDLWFPLLSNFLLFYYTDVFGLPVAFAGGMMMLGKLWDGVNDPIIGSIIDRTETRKGRFRPYLARCIPLAAMFMFLIFAGPDLSTTGKMIYAVATYYLFTAIATFNNISMHTLPSLMSTERDGRMKAVAFKQIGGALCGIALANSVDPIVGCFDDPMQGWRVVGVVAGVVILVFSQSIVILAKRYDTWDRIKLIRKHTTASQSMWRGIGMALSARPLPLLLIAQGTNVAAFVIAGAGGKYFFTYYLHEPGWFKLFLTMQFALGLIGIVLAPILARRFGKKKSFMVATVLGMVFPVVLLTTRMQSLTVLLPVAGFSIVASVVASATTWTMIFDCIDYIQYHRGVRPEGLVMAVYAFSNKLGAASAAGLAGGFLAWFGYVPKVEQTPRALLGILLMMTLVPIVSGIASLTAMFFYPISDEIEQSIQKQLFRE